MKGIMFNNHYGLESAVLEGRKTQTRRVDKRSLCLDDAVRCGHKCFRVRGKFLECHTAEDFSDCFIQFRLPYEIGEVLAIKQSYRDVNKFYSTNSDTYPYGETMGAGWNNKLFVKNDLMPLQIKVTNIRVERLQDISEADCLAEGVNDCGFGFGIKGIKESGFIETARECYTTLIDKISGKGTWEFNPYAWVIEFELVKESDNEDNFAIKKEKGGQK